jgi:hypothetical protein
MGLGLKVREQSEADAAERQPLPDLKPWREAGWIFRDGGCVAIERRGEATRARELVD